MKLKSFLQENKDILWEGSHNLHAFLRIKLQVSNEFYIFIQPR